MSVEMVPVVALSVGDELVLENGHTVARIIGIGPGSEPTAITLRVVAIDPDVTSPERVIPANTAQPAPRLVLDSPQGEWTNTIQASEAQIGVPVRSFQNGSPAWIVGIREHFEESTYDLLMRDVTDSSLTTRSYEASDPLETP